jgi:hypothetical protein
MNACEQYWKPARRWPDAADPDFHAFMTALQNATRCLGSARVPSHTATANFARPVFSPAPRLRTASLHDGQGLRVVLAPKPNLRFVCQVDGDDDLRDRQTGPQSQSPSASWRRGTPSAFERSFCHGPWAARRLPLADTKQTTHAHFVGRKHPLRSVQQGLSVVCPARPCHHNLRQH